MNKVTKGGSDFIGYEYKEISIRDKNLSMYLDGYYNLGWKLDENIMLGKTNENKIIRLKRDRKIINKAELTRLQRHFEACLEEIKTLEKSTVSFAKGITSIIAIIGTVFIALSTFAVTHEPPLIIPCILFAIPGFVGWILPFWSYKVVLKKRTEKVKLFIEKKYDEIYEICEKGNSILTK